MVKLDDKYFINADENQFILVEKIIIKSGKMQGEEIFKSLRYYSTIGSALDGYYELKTRLYVRENDCNISEIIKELEKIKDEIKSLVEI